MTDVFDNLDEYTRRLNAARAYLGLSQAGFGELLGVSESTIIRREGGDLKDVAARKAWAEKIAALAEVPPEILGLEDRTQTDTTLQSVQVELRKLRRAVAAAHLLVDVDDALGQPERNDDSE